MADFLSALKNETNYTYTENGAVSLKSTMSGVMDLFALGAAYRERDDQDCIRLFDAAFKEDETLALKCLFYLRDVRGGQGERRFFRVVLHNLAMTNPEVVRRNLDNIAEFGRWDDLYALVDTRLENEAFTMIKNQLTLDMSCKTPSLLGKWLKSENASSHKTKILAAKTRKALGLSARDYRKMLSKLRAKINIVERLMSANKWDEIEFDKIPSRAGFIYRNAFARRDIIKEKYKNFALDEKTKVNAGTLYPYECVKEVLDAASSGSYWNGYHATIDQVQRAMLNKYWDNLTDYFNNANFNGIVVADTSGSMSGTPISVAISLALYCAEKCSGPYKDHFITFSEYPALQQVKGSDFVGRVLNLEKTNWGWNTNIEAVFDLLLSAAVDNHLKQEDIPQNVIIVSDMEFDSAVMESSRKQTLFDNINHKWRSLGYKMPHLIFWNVNARHDLIPMKDDGGVTYVSGFSPVLFEQILQGKTAWDLVLAKLMSERYANVR